MVSGGGGAPHVRLSGEIVLAVAFTKKMCLLLLLLLFRAVVYILTLVPSRNGCKFMIFVLSLLCFLSIVFWLIFFVFLVLRVCFLCFRLRLLTAVPQHPPGKERVLLQTSLRLDGVHRVALRRRGTYVRPKKKRRVFFRMLNVVHFFFFFFFCVFFCP